MSVKKLVKVAGIMLIAALLITLGGCAHRHVWPETWEYSMLTHWRECEECGEREQAAHTYAEGVCTVCGYECEHVSWKHDEKVHWLNCDICGIELREEHTFDEQSRCTVCGYMCEHDVYSDGVCTSCGYVCEHKEGIVWHTDTERHWKECTVCGAEIMSEPHEFSESVCVVCGYVCKHSNFELVTYNFCDIFACDTCGTIESATIRVDELRNEINSVCFNWMASSVQDYAEDAERIDRVLEEFRDVKFKSGAYNWDWSEIVEIAPLGEVCGVDLMFKEQYGGGIIDSDGNIILGKINYYFSFYLFPDGSAEMTMYDDEYNYVFIAEPGAIDYYALIEIYSEVGIHSYLPFDKVLK